jgi:hypothetical protein
MTTFRRLTCATSLFTLSTLCCVLAGASGPKPADGPDPDGQVVAVDVTQLPGDLLVRLTPYLPPEAATAETFILHTPGLAGKDDKGEKKGKKGKGDKGKDDKVKGDKGKDDKGKTGSTVVQIDLSKLPPELTAQLLRYALNSSPEEKKDKGGKKDKEKKAGKKD